MNNSFRLREIRILTSEFDFEDTKRKEQYSEIANLTCKTSISKKLKKVKCVVTYAAGNYDSPIYIRAEARSIFKIIQAPDLETLEQDAEEYCAPEAIKRTSEIIQKIVRLHVGNNVSVQSDDDSFDDYD